MRALRSITSGLLALCLFVALAIPVFAANPQKVTVEVNGAPVQWRDAEPFIDENGRTMVPLRAVAEEMGLEAEWNGQLQTAVFTLERKYVNYTMTNKLSFQVGSSEAILRATQTHPGGFSQTIKSVFEMDTAPVLSGGRIYAPLRYLAQAFYFDVSWDEATFTAYVDFVPVELFWTVNNQQKGVFFTVMYYPGEAFDNYHGMEIKNLQVNGNPAEIHIFSEKELEGQNQKFGTNFYVYAFSIPGEYAPGEYLISWDIYYYLANGTVYDETESISYSLHYMG